MEEALSRAIRRGDENAANGLLNKMEITTKNRSEIIWIVAYGGCVSTANILFGMIKLMDDLSFEAFWGDMYYSGLHRATEHCERFLNIFLEAPINAGLRKDDIDEGRFHGYVTTAPFATDQNRMILVRWLPLRSVEVQAGLRKYGLREDGSWIPGIKKHSSEHLA